MPIINAITPMWLKGQIYNPSEKTSNSAVFSNFSSTQISDRSSVTDITYGSPYEKIWDIGHTYWQTNFTCPILLVEKYKIINSPYYNATSLINVFLKKMISPTGFNSGDNFETGTLKNKWDFYPHSETIESNNADYIIQKISIDISENDSSFSVSILSTMDIRRYFNITSNIIEKPLIDFNVYRLASPYDIEILSNCIGSPFGFQQITEKQWPIQTNDLQKYSSLLKEFHLTLESNIIKTATIGMPTSRTFLGINSLKCSGNIKYVPLYFVGENVSFQENGAIFSPAGWTVDLQNIDYISNCTRHGGKFNVSMDLSNQIYVGLKIKNRNEYIVDGRNINTPLGPVSTSSWGINMTPGQINDISVEFTTNPGVISF